MAGLSRLNDIKDVYVSETEDNIQKLNDNLLILEKNPHNKQVLTSLMRIVHTIEGSSAAMEFTSTSRLAHVLEDIFDCALNKNLIITPEIINTSFAAIDALTKALPLVTGDNKEVNLDGIIQKLKKVAGKPAMGKPKWQKNSRAELLQLEIVPKVDYIKVPIFRLDRLLKLTEELLTVRTSLEQITASLKETDKLAPLVDHLSRLVSDIKSQVMEVRLVPIEQVFARFPRMVRDLSHSLLKEVEFQTIGGGIEFDRSIVDKLGEPLVHLLRNAIDHGIDKYGKIILKASREKDLAIISVEDTGRGINWPKVVAAAIRKGIITEKLGEKYQSDLKQKGFKADSSEIAKLVFGPNLSTKDVVTEISGRGVGMGVIKDFADSVRGRVVIESPLTSLGGTRITLELPFIEK